MAAVQKDLTLGSNASLSYVPSTGKALLSFPLWVTQLSQEHTLNGQTSQSLHTKHFYPRSYTPGDMHVTAQSGSNDAFRSFARFIRAHHLSLISVTGNFAVNDPSDVKYKQLLRLQIESEKIDMRGWVKSFTFTNKGVAEPFPLMEFDFTVAFDAHALNSTVSKTIRDWATVIKLTNTEDKRKK